MMDATEANRLVNEGIASVAEPTVLGFLPLGESIQDAILEAIRVVINGDHGRLRGCLLHAYPAATAYCLAVSAARNMRGRAFYTAWKTDLNVLVPPSAREDLAAAYARTCRKLGLVVDAADVADVHTRWFVFQAGIVPHWVEPLGAGIRATLNQRPFPDLEDEDQLRRFARALGEHVFNQPHLEKALGTELGILLCRQILKAQRANDYSKLPSHLSNEIKSAVETASSKVHLRSPFIRIEPNLGVMFLHLPSQSVRLTTEFTHWIVDGKRYSARVARDIPLDPQWGEGFEVQLNDLADKLLDHSFNVSGGICEDRPFMLFRAGDGRHCSVSYQEPHTDLDPGDYILVLDPRVDCDEIDEAILMGADVQLPVEMFPSREPIRLSLGERRWAVRPSLTPGIFMDSEGVGEVRVLGDRRLFYRNVPGFQPYIPIDDLDDEEVLAIEVFKEGGERLVGRDTTRDQLEESHPYSYVEPANELVAEALSSLASGIHGLTLSITCKRKRIETSILFWKGLESISISDGFGVSEMPCNVDWSRSRGLRPNGNFISWDHSSGNRDVVITLSHGAELQIPKPGVSCRIRDVVEAWEETVRPGCQIVLLSNDVRQMVIECGGFEQWTVCCGESVVAKVCDSNPNFTMSLAGLAGQFGASGRLVARSENGRTVPLFSFSRPLIATAPKIEQNAGLVEESVSFTIGKEKLAALGVIWLDFLEHTVSRSESKEVTRLSFETNEQPNALLSGAVSVNVKDEGEHYSVVAKVKLRELAGKFLFFDFVYAEDGSEEWKPLACAEKHGISFARFGFEPPTILDSSSEWAALVSHARRFRQSQMEVISERLDDVGADDLELYLERTSKALAFKYPSSAWHRRLEWMQDIPVILAETCFSIWDSSVDVWGKIASRELEKLSTSKHTAVTNQLLIGTQPALLRAPAKAFAKEETNDNAISRSLAEASIIELSDSLAAYAREHYGERIQSDIFQGFNNLTKVSSGAAPEFEGFRFAEFVGRSIQELVELEEGGEVWNGEILLSAGHLHHVIRQLNRRTRGFDMLSDTESPKHALVRTFSSIERIHRNVGVTGGNLRAILGIPFGTEVAWQHPIFEGKWGQHIADILFLTTAIGRLAAYEVISVSKFRLLLNQLYDCQDDDAEQLRNRLCIVLSLAPELFTFYQLFWQFLLKPKSNLS